MINKLKEKKWIFVSGKGGTGKTTTASSIALSLAKEGKKTLIVSLDPAHSLGDSLNEEIGPEIKNVVHKNLYALEFDVKKAFKEEQQFFSNLSGNPQFPGMDMMGLGEDYAELLANTPFMPAEYFEGIGFIKLFKMIDESDFDIIVFDTAPTGHTLKLLELPEFLDSFLGKMLKIQLRLSSLMNTFKKFFGFGEEIDHSKLLLDFLKEAQSIIKDVKAKITDESKTEFIVVGIPTMMSLMESIRLVTELTFYGIPNTFIVINMVRIYGGNECIFSKKMSQMHLSLLKEYAKEFPDKDIRVIPFFAEEIRGPEKLALPIKYINEFTIDDAIQAIENGKTIE